MIDIVYPLGSGSKWDDNELRYSLRSVEKHVSGYRNIVIIGHKPEWLTDVIHIPYEDIHHEKETRIALKIGEVIDSVPDLSMNFLFMNDDHFFTRPCHAESFPDYCFGTLREAYERNSVNIVYRNAIENTIKLIGNDQKLYFDIHLPMVMNKLIIKPMIDVFDWDTPGSYVIKSLYGNIADTKPVEITDCKISHVYNREGVMNRISGRPAFSVGDRGLSKDMKSIFEELYPKKSRFER